MCVIFLSVFAMVVLLNLGVFNGTYAGSRFCSISGKGFHLDGRDLMLNSPAFPFGGKAQ